MDLVACDNCEVLVLLDNVSDLLSTVPASVTGEIANVVRAGADHLHGRCLCCAQWGLSLIIQVEREGARHTVLFDSGPEGYGIERNGQKLGVDFGTIETAVFSHGHWDHVGGMETALRLITARNGGQPIEVHVNPAMFVRRAAPLPGGGLLPFADVPSPEQLSAAGARVVNDDSERMLLDRMFFLSGEIPRVTPYEQGMTGQVAEQPDGSWVPDPLLLDERWLAVHVQGLGAIVFTACSHAGVINVLQHARDALDPIPLYAVMGGFHLSGAAFEPLIGRTVEDMGRFGLQVIVPGHCTGWRATHRLVEAFGDGTVIPSAVGRRHLFQSRTARRSAAR